MWPFYAVINLVLIVLVGYGLATNTNASLGTGLYLLCMGALCFFPMCLTRSFQERHALSIVFLALYFFSFATGDLGMLLAGEGTGAGRDMLTEAEAVIVASVVCFIVGYLIALSLGRARQDGICRREWAPMAIRFVAIAFWATGFVAVFFVQTSFDAILAHPFWSQLGGIISLARLLNPLGALMLTYLYVKQGEKSALMLFFIIASCDFLMGLYGDTKEQAFRDPILFLMARFLLTGRVPVVTAILIFALAGASFSFFAEYREELKTNNRSRADALEKVFESFSQSTKSSAKDTSDKSLGERFGSGLEYVSSRTGLKPSVETIVNGTGDRAPFMNGSTIKPILYAFIPRNIMPNKPDSSVGRIFNRAFHISADPDTYISPSQNGELYWNFGWTGVLIGMIAIGFIIGTVNSVVNLGHLITLPRLLILVMTIYLVCLRFEDGIAIQYTYWMRATLLLLLVDFLMPKVRVRASVERK